MVTQELLKQLFTYRDGKLYWNVSNPRTAKGTETGTINSRGYKCTTVNQKTYLTHRLIFMYHYGYFPEMVDHIDGNCLNNDISNLRGANKYENQYNAKIRADNKTGVKGVHICPHTGKYVARIRIDGKRLVLGSFLTLDEAKNEVTKTRLTLHKEYARE